MNVSFHGAAEWYITRRNVWLKRTWPRSSAAPNRPSSRRFADRHTVPEQMLHPVGALDANYTNLKSPRLPLSVATLTDCNVRLSPKELEMIVFPPLLVAWLSRAAASADGFISGVR